MDEKLKELLKNYVKEKFWKSSIFKKICMEGTRIIKNKEIKVLKQKDG